MKQNTLIILSIALIFAGCNKTDTVIITKAEYEQLKRDTVVPEYPKLVTIPIVEEAFDAGVMVGYTGYGEETQTFKAMKQEFLTK
jgi:hypothetical protein